MICKSIFNKSLLGCVALLVLVTALPICVGLLMGMPRIALDNFTDSVFYLAYSRNFTDLVLRYGFIYYATRFGGILPDAISGRIFGEIHGIFVLRWILLGIVSLALYICFRKRYGLLGGLLASVLWSFNPAVLRLSCTTYVDSTSVPFLILGCCLFNLGSNGVIWNVAAGILLGLASSAHLYAVFAILLLLPWLIASGWHDRNAMLRRAFWAGIGFVLTWLFGWLWYAWAWKMPALLSPTIEVMQDLGGGQTSFWKKKLSVALHDAPAWYAVLVMIPATIVASWKGSSLMRGAAISLLGSALFFWGGDLFGSAYVLSMPFYYSFLIPVTILSAATLAGEVLHGIREGNGRSLFALLLVASAVLPAILTRNQSLTPGIILLCFVPIALLGVLMEGTTWARCLRSLTATALLMAVVFVALTGMFSQFLGHYPDRDVPVVELAEKLRQELPSASEAGRVMRFWYNDDLSKEGAAERRMIGSFWLHRFGLLTGEKDEPIPFLKLNDSNAMSVTSSGPDVIIIFDQDPAKVEDAVKLFSKKKVPYLISKRCLLTASSDPSRRLAVAILERTTSFSGNAKDLVDLHQIQVIHHGSMVWDHDEPVIKSGKFKFWDFARLKIGQLKKGDCIEVNLKVKSGFIRCALNGNNGRTFDHIEKWPTATDQKIVFTVTQDMPDAELSFHSMYPKGTTTSAVIKTVEIKRYKP